MARRRIRRTRRNAPLTDAQASALKSILAAHGAAPAAPAKTNPKRRAGKKRRISASLRRKLIANLRKARAAKKRKASRRGR
jgi:hypothetical protein